ncbi:CotO family spore coat protein [Gottfriedia luciferensis]|uniref:CotO family spore coat protein n=1 Tax=Gottfriedia luciferensis TaxID=178774 RepID=UPI000B44F1DE|nr:CotO family spore coat protein [Gottfriedia luciferensis]
MARKESREGVKPLLYIAQPDFEEAKLNVQQSYVVKVNKQDQQTKTKDKEYVVSEVENYEENEEIEEIVEIETFDNVDNDNNELDDQPEEENTWVKKPFKAMTNEEKVLFMINKPHYIPKVECRIRTNNDFYIGYIMGYNEGKVSIKVASNNNLEIDIENIVSIQMVGI